MKTLLPCIAGTLLLAACHSPTSPTNLPPGTYKDTNKTTTSDGTEIERDTTTRVYKNSDGSKSAVIENTTTKDPEGLFNKTTTHDSTTRY